MLHVVGGAYLEFCPEPRWWQLFGSGGRAAAALVTLSDGVVLSTYISDDCADMLEALAETFDFRLEVSGVPQTPAFAYAHGLSEPVISPSRSAIAQATPLDVQAENVLRFGFLEGDTVVSGRRVVYDPQDPADPRPFRENGSTAEHLAIVANEREVTLLMGGRPLADIGTVLIEGQGADVVAVKRGAFGALVVTGEGSASVPAFRTDTVWPIGSGDVFSAVFAHYWTERGTDPITAAREASLATAYYCSTRSLPIPSEPSKFPGFAASPLDLPDDPQSMPDPQAYLAGPFFTMGERWVINEAKAALESIGMKVFSPLHDVGRGKAADVAPADLEGLERSRVVFAVVDGLDAGTLFEVGYARAKGLPVVAFVQNESLGNLTMLEGSGCRVVDDFTSAVYHTAWSAVAG